MCITLSLFTFVWQNWLFRLKIIVFFLYLSSIKIIFNKQELYLQSKFIWNQHWLINYFLSTKSQIRKLTGECICGQWESAICKPTTFVSLYTNKVESSLPLLTPLEWPVGKCLVTDTLTTVELITASNYPLEP